MPRLLDKFCGIWTRICEGVGSGLLVMIVVSLFIQVFTRYVMNNSATWTEEFARFCFIWFTMVGSGVVTRRGSHACISILSDRLKGRVKCFHMILVYCVVIAATFVLAVNAMPVIRNSADRLSAALTLPYSYIYIAVPVGCFGIIVNSVNAIVQLLIGNRAPKNPA